MWIVFSWLLLLPKQITEVSPHVCLTCLSAPAPSPAGELEPLVLQITGSDRSPIQLRALGETARATRATLCPKSTQFA